MKRRSFVKASLLSGSMSAAVVQASALITGQSSSGRTGREYYELRTYLLKDESQQKQLENYYEQAAIPAYNRAGIKNIGVFTALKPEGQTKLFVLIPYLSVSAFAETGAKLMADKVYTTAAAPYLSAPATSPAYERAESELLSAFTGMPVMEVPANQPRIFELRRYENPGETASKKKEEMFTQGGEIAIFRRTGLQPVFFGNSLIGGNQPNITYMVTFADMEAHDKAWKAFGGDSEWAALKAIPDYTDARLITKITSTLLVPATFSQI